MKLGKKQIGKNMQFDIFDAAKWSIKSKIADPKKICLWGISYSGSSAVMSFLMRQGLFACALSSGGVYNFDSIL